MIITYIPAFIGALLLYYFHTIGMDRGVYDAVPYFDVGMHFFGGLVLGTLMYAVTKSLKYAFITAIVLALGWEVFEYVLDIAVTYGQAYWPDTILDIIMDILGIALAIDLSRKAFKSIALRKQVR